MARRGHGVADAGLPDILDPRDEVADLPGGQPVPRDRVWRDHPDLESLVACPRRHHQAAIPGGQPAVDHPHISDHTPVGVVDTVEDHGPGGGVRITHGCGNPPDDLVEQLRHALAGLARHQEHVVRITADDLRQLGRVLLRLRRRKIDLVEYRDDLQVVLEGQVQVGQRLCLDALGRIDEQHRALTGRERPTDLVREVDMTRSVDQMQDVVATIIGLPRQTDALRFDRDATLTLDVHLVQILGTHVTGLDDAGDTEHPVGERRLTVVDVSDDAEVADRRLVDRCLVDTTGVGGWGHAESSRFVGTDCVIVPGPGTQGSAYQGPARKAHRAGSRWSHRRDAVRPRPVDATGAPSGRGSWVSW